MWITLAILVALPLAALIYLATLDGTFNVRRNLEIRAPVDSVYDVVVDLESWPHWSPWLIHEPGTKLVYSDDCKREGGYYSWDGKVVGAGRLTHISIKPGRSIRQQIDFERPFKASNEVAWEFEARGDRTLVSWEMHGRMPFLFRFMTRKMEPMISRDYDLGLALLSGYVNGVAPHPQLAFVGRQKLDAFSYWSIPCRGNLRQLEATRQSNIDALMAAAAGKTGLALTLFHQFDPMASSYDAEVAIPITEQTPASNYTRREFGGGDYFRMTLQGDHRFLPLAWYALGCHCRMHGIKTDRARPALEIYHEDPGATDDSNKLTTALYIPVR